MRCQSVGWHEAITGVTRREPSASLHPLSLFSCQKRRPPIVSTSPFALQTTFLTRSGLMKSPCKVNSTQTKHQLVHRHRFLSYRVTIRPTTSIRGNMVSSIRATAPVYGIAELHEYRTFGRDASYASLWVLCRSYPILPSPASSPCRVPLSHHNCISRPI